MSALSRLPTQSLNKKHLRVLTENHFEAHGTIGSALKSDEYDGCRVLYAISDPTGEQVIYVGDTEVGRDLRGRLKAHMNARDKAGHVELESQVWIHFMVTEFKVLSDFEDVAGALPKLNKRKVQK